MTDWILDIGDYSGALSRLSRVRQDTVHFLMLMPRHQRGGCFTNNPIYGYLVVLMTLLVAPALDYIIMPHY